MKSDDLFTTNLSKENLKKKREKLKADRFKQIEYNTRSKVDEVLIKRMVGKMTRREAAGLEPVKKQQKTTNRRTAEEEGLTISATSGVPNQKLQARNSRSTEPISLRQKTLV